MVWLVKTTDVGYDRYETAGEFGRSGSREEKPNDQHRSVHQRHKSINQGNESFEQGHVPPTHQHSGIRQEQKSPMRLEEPIQHDNEPVMRRAARPDVANVTVEV